MRSRTDYQIYGADLVALFSRPWLPGVFSGQSSADCLLAPPTGSRRYGASSQQLQTTTVLDVRDFGAKGDGVSDDSAAIQAAVNALGTAGGVVFFPADKTYLLGSAPIQLPRGITGSLVLSGYGANIKLSSGAPRFTDLHKIADQDTFQNITLEGFHIDANNIGGRNHVVIGTYINGAQIRNINIEHITVRDITAVNIPTDPTLASHRTGIWLSTYQQNHGEATQNVLRDIHIKNVRLEGGNAGILIIGTGGQGTGNYNILVDDVSIENCWHSTMIEPTAFSPPPTSTSATMRRVAQPGSRVLMVRALAIMVWK